MSQIKEDLKEVVENTVIPEVEDYLVDLNKLLEKNEANENDMESIRDLESFLVELQNVVLAINEEKMNDEEASVIYQRVLDLIEQSKEH